MKVLHLLDSSAPKIAGYSTRSRAIVNAQRKMGIEPVVLTTVRQRNKEGIDVEYIDQIPHYRTLRPKEPQRVPILEMEYLRRRTLEVARKENVELIHAHSPMLCGIPGLIAARQLRLPYVYEMRSLWEDAAVEKGATSSNSFRYKLTRFGDTLLVRNANSVVCICEGLKKDIVSRGIPEEKVHVVPNGVDTERFIRREPDVDLKERLGLGGKIVVGYIGTFFGFEGVTDLVSAIASLIDSGRNDVAGLIVGRGETYSKCKELAEQFGLSNEIRHPGRVEHDEIDAYYSIIDVLVYPRWRYRITELVTPLKPLEGMAMGKPVVASDVGGLKELIDDGNTGMLFESGNVAALANCLARLLDDPKLRETLGSSGQQWVKNNRDWRNIVFEYENAYQE